MQAEAGASQYQSRNSTSASTKELAELEEPVQPQPSTSPRSNHAHARHRVRGPEEIDPVSHVRQFPSTRPPPQFGEMRPGHTPVKRSPSTMPPPHPQHLSSGVAYPEKSPRAMHSTLAIQHQHIVPYQHYAPRVLENFSSHYNPNQYAFSSGWSTPSTDEYPQPIHTSHIPLSHSIGGQEMHYSTPSPYPSSNWANLPQDSAPTASTSSVTPVNHYPPQYVAEQPAVYDEQYVHATYPLAYPVAGTVTHRHISPTGSTELVRSPYTGGSVHHSTPPHTPENPERYTPSPHAGGESSSASLQPQTSGQRYYTHKDQLHFFKEALKLPFSVQLSPFVPQMMYKPHTNSDKRRYVEEVELDPPIYFWAENPTECGISLADALHSRVRRLSGGEDTVLEGRGPSVSIRLEWPGYRQWSRQIPTKDFRTPPGPITKAKLAKNIAKCVQRFILERQSQRIEDDSNERWRVGTSPGTTRLEDLVLVSLHHVSMGSWQPQLRMCRASQTRHAGPSHWT
ncbi:hypothetical protein V5O48_011763 [Marasmius crinis-equi]|uniref:Uncharacterized protein n=1 Tax=Marasmius crinis-equi TaxID=585013 RepID=A0ABR3F500_9AGAR